MEVQLSFPPRLPRSEHVTRVAPSPERSVLHLGEHPGGGETASVDDLAVTADAAQMYLVHAPTGRRVVPLIPHALEMTTHTPPLARFIAEVAGARCAELRPLDFGAARVLPYVPRIRYRKTILSAARWHLDRAALAASPGGPPRRAACRVAPGMAGPGPRRAVGRRAAAAPGPGPRPGPAAPARPPGPQAAGGPARGRPRRRRRVARPPRRDPHPDDPGRAAPPAPAGDHRARGRPPAGDRHGGMRPDHREPGTVRRPHRPPARARRPPGRAGTAVVAAPAPRHDPPRRSRSTSRCSCA